MLGCFHQIMVDVVLLECITQCTLRLAVKSHVDNFVVQQVLTYVYKD